MSSALSKIANELAEIRGTLHRIRKDNLLIADHNLAVANKPKARYPETGNIAEATEIALQIDGYIMDTKKKFLFIKPTNNPSTFCGIYTPKDDSLGRGWQPSADDLVSKHWTAINKEELLSLLPKVKIF